MYVLDIPGGVLSTTDICNSLGKTNFALPNQFALLLYCKGFQRGSASIWQERTFYKGFV